MNLSSLSSRLLPLALLCGLAPLAASAQSTTATNPTVISTVPYTITTSGNYIVAHDLTDTSGTTAISINVANVVLDLNGYFVSGGTNDSFVIYANGVAGVTIKNGTVANANTGIYFGESDATRDELVDKVTVTHCITGVECDTTAPGSAITNSVLSSVTGHGMYLNGGFRVENNIIDAGASGSTYGIFSTANELVIGNTISNCTNGIYYSNGATDETAGKFLNNLLYNCTTPFTGGVNATGNN